MIQTIKHGHTTFQTQVGCDGCRGTKRDSTSSNIPRCKICSGSGKVESTNTLEIDLPRDILKENIVHIKGAGSWNNNSYSDLTIILNLDIEGSKNFSLENNILTYTMHINFSEGICGFNKIIEHPSGTNLCIKSDLGNIINPNQAYVLEKLGLKSKYDIDPLYLKFIIHYPETIVIPDSKKLAFTYKNLEKILGGKLEPDYEGLDPIQIYNLNSLEKINRPDLDHESHPEYEDEPPSFHTVQPECVQQ